MSKTMDRPLRVRPEILADGSSALSTDGAPSDSVALALLGVVKEKIDLWFRASIRTKTSAMT